MEKSKSNDFIVREFTNESGKQYEVGYPKASGYTEENVSAMLADVNSKEKLSSSEYEEINLKPEGASFISRAAHSIGVPAAYVDTIGEEYYQLNFINTKGWGFTFKDETYDTYYCSTVRNGLHWMRYGSKRPTMIGVK